MSHSIPIVKNKDCHRLVNFLYRATDTEDELMGISDYWQIIALTMEKEYGAAQKSGCPYVCGKKQYFVMQSTYPLKMWMPIKLTVSLTAWSWSLLWTRGALNPPLIRTVEKVLIQPVCESKALYWCNKGYNRKICIMKKQLWHDMGTMVWHLSLL